MCAGLGGSAGDWLPVVGFSGDDDVIATIRSCATSVEVGVRLNMILVTNATDRHTYASNDDDTSYM